MSTCPFDVRLARTPYLVIPKLVLQAMSMDWRWRLEALLREADDTGMETPGYYVFRSDPSYSLLTRSDSEDEYSPISDLGVLRSDEWADYRHGDIREVCPSFHGESA